MAIITETISVTFSWASAYANTFGINSYDINCKMYVYLSFIFCVIGPWINILSWVDRYLSVKHPIEFKFRKEFKYQVLAVLFTCCLIILLDIPYLVYVGVMDNICSTTSMMTGIYLTFLLGLNLQLILPSICMIILNSMIIHKLIIKRKKLNKKLTKEVKLAKVLFSINLVFLILNLPFFLSASNIYCVLTYLYYLDIMWLILYKKLSKLFWL